MNKNTEVFSVTLKRDNSNQSWGFRLQGGSDFTIPLSIQSVASGTIAEQCGVQAGDAVLKINDKPSDELEHEEAKRRIVLSGDQVILLLQRGAVKIWKPVVTPLSQLRSGSPGIGTGGGADPSHVGSDPYSQKTSLAADKQEIVHIGVAHNRAARPFPGGGGVSGGAQVAPAPSRTYNNPRSLYSEESAAEARGSAKVDNLAGNVAHLTVHVDGAPDVGTRGVSPTFAALNANNSAEYNARLAEKAQRSAVHDEVKDGEEIRYHGYTDPNKQSRSFKLLEQGLEEGGEASHVTAPPTAMPTGIRSVKAPTTVAPNQNQQPQHSLCSQCGTVVTGVFIRVRDKPMHSDCFKCHRCSKSLKNIGFFAVEDKLYCEEHAIEASKPPGPGMVAVPTYK